jgi:hypothetical protein
MRFRSVMQYKRSFVPRWRMHKILLLGLFIRNVDLVRRGTDRIWVKLGRKNLQGNRQIIF